jgi:CheY-specific phosphatase CheX
MFFAEVMSEEEGSQGSAEDASECVSMSVGFRGELSGCATVTVSAESARRLAADFLALEDQPPAREAVAAVIGELTNMICGAVLSRVSSAGSFNLAPPEPLSIREEAEGSICRLFSLGDGTLRVCLYCGREDGKAAA